MGEIEIVRSANFAILKDPDDVEYPFILGFASGIEDDEEGFRRVDLGGDKNTLGHSRDDLKELYKLLGDFLYPGWESD